MEKTHLTLTATIAGRELELRVFRHCLPSQTFFTVETIEKGKRTACYVMTKSPLTGRFAFLKGIIPFGVREREQEIAERITSHFYNYNLN